MFNVDLWWKQLLPGFRVGDVIDMVTGAHIVGPRSEWPRRKARQFIVTSVGGRKMKVGKNKLKMSSGKVKTFGSEKKRDNFERVARAVKHGWKKPKKK